MTDNRIVFITGVFGGIGYATAKCFKAHGWTVLGMDKFCGRDSESVVDKFFHMDCSKQVNVKEAADYIGKIYGGLDCLVNNAAVQVCESIDDTTEEQWDLVFGSNIRANFLFIKNMHDLLRQVQGNVVNISSVHAFATSKNISAYAASKGAILAFTRSTALEFAEDGIRVNTVLPGAVNTNMLREGMARGNFGGESIDQRIENLGLKTPSRKVGMPGEIAKVIYFLGDNESSSYITGQSIVADGGALAQLSTEV